MANGNLQACLKVTLVHEGGWSDHPKDPGGATMKGVTLATYRMFRPGATKAELRAISDADLQTVYRKGFWNPLNAELLPYGVDLATFDAGVNSGIVRGAKWLQGAVGAVKDGVVGPATVRAVGNSDGKAVIKRLCAARLGFVHGLRTWSTFGKGWARRIADIEARGVSMYLTMAQRKPAGNVAKELAADGKTAEGKAKSQQTSGAGTGAAGGTAGAGGAVSGEIDWLLIGGGLLLVAVVAGLLLWKAMQNRERARAYEVAALEAAGRAV